MKERIHSKFTELYGEGGVFYAAAGRINLIGEHTDYNGGYVFPGAIDKGLMAEIKPNGTDRVRVYSLDYNAASEFGLEEADKPAEPLWRPSWRWGTWSATRPFGTWPQPSTAWSTA